MSSRIIALQNRVRGHDAPLERLMHGTAQPDIRREWTRHWGVVLAGLFGVGLTSTHVYSIGPFLGPIEQEFGWPRAQISSGVAVITLIGAFTSPFVGMLLDKVGSRRVALPGALIFCLGTAGLSLATNSVWLWWLLWAVVAAGGVLIKPTTWTLAVASLFEKGRGLALAVTLCGTGLASAVMPAVATWLIARYGWREAYPIMAMLMGGVTFPIFYFFLTSAADQRRLAQASIVAPAPRGATFADAMRSVRFYKLTIAGFAFTTAAIGITSNLVPIISSMHVDRLQAAGIAGLAGLMSVIGRLSTGVLIDRYNGNVVGGICVLIPLASCALLIGGGSSIAVIISAVVLLGLALGAELDIVAYLTARHFGTARFGTIFGTITSFWSLAVAIGPTLANHVYDQTHSYMPALIGFMPLFVVASICLFSLGSFPDYPDIEATAPPRDPS